MYKFGLRIGALAKIKVNDLLPNGIIIFREKNSKLIKRQLLKETFDILTQLIIECELENNNYIFYYFKFENDEDKRSLFLAQKYRILLYESGVFSLSSTESLCSHIFRATHAIKVFKGDNIEFARKELGHRFSSTTINNYIRPEERQLNILEEKNMGIFDSVKFLNKKRKNKNYVKRIIKENYNHNPTNLDSLQDLEDKNFTDKEEDEEDMIDGDFEMNKSTFFLTGHFYDDADLLSFKNEKNKNVIIENIPNNVLVDDTKKANLKIRNLTDKNNKSNLFRIKIKLNKQKIMKSLYKDKETFNNLLNIQDFEKILAISKKDPDIINFTKIKNKIIKNIASNIL